MSVEQRKNEILAKKAKLAELKRTRELRERGKHQRESLGASPEVCTCSPSTNAFTKRQLTRQAHRRPLVQKPARNSTISSARSSTSHNQTEVRVERRQLQKGVARAQLVDGLPYQLRSLILDPKHPPKRQSPSTPLKLPKHYQKVKSLLHSKLRRPQDPKLPLIALGYRLQSFGHLRGKMITRTMTSSVRRHRLARLDRRRG